MYPVSAGLQQYLQHYGRDTALPVLYSDLMHYQYTNAIKDKNGKHTHWERVVYEKEMLEQLQQQLMMVYQLLHASDHGTFDHLKIQHIDFCEFANSMPFRITIVNTQNDTQKKFYIKSADASRIYGLELEQLLTANKTNFFYHQNTLIEQHIDGIPGDIFLEEIKNLTENEKINLAAAFVAFNERCFITLLGDMRSYNFVVIKNDADNYRIKAIDFDQQSYEGKLNLYLPQFYKENHAYVQLVLSMLHEKHIETIREEERRVMRDLFMQSKERMNHLLQVIATEEISENYKVVSLRKELGIYFKTRQFAHCHSMGELVKKQLDRII